jgi:hypothetical protein
MVEATRHEMIEKTPFEDLRTAAVGLFHLHLSLPTVQGRFTW